MTETLEEKRKSADELITEVLKKMDPEKKERALDILTGFVLAAGNERKAG